MAELGSAGRGFQVLTITDTAESSFLSSCLGLSTLESFMPLPFKCPRP